MQTKNEAVIRASVRGLAWGSAVAAGLALSACSGGTDGISPAAVAGKSISGKALGGQQPVVGATVSLYAASTSGYGASSAALATTTTGPGGTWTFSGVSCPSGPTDVPLYVVATGGSAVGGSSNSAIGLSSALGPCSSAINGTGYNIDEVTTVASAYALAQFLDSTGVHLGTSSTNTTGLANAVANVALLADLDAGTAQTMLPSGASGTLPAATLNSVANILAACVNSSGASSSQCTSLISAATPSGGTAPATTLQAALNIAHNPGNNVAALYALAGSANAPFQTPTPLSVQPNDWTLAVNFTGGSLDATAPTPVPDGLAVDAQGDVWVSLFNSNSNVNGGFGAILQLSPLGQQAGPYLDSGNINGPVGVAIDKAGQVWIANEFGGVSGLNSVDGTSLAGSPYTSSAFNSPEYVTTDQAGNVWVADGSTNGTSAYVFKLSASNNYAITSYIPPADGGGSNSIWSGIVTDTSGNLWLSDAGNPFLVHLGAADPTKAISGSPYAGGAGNGQNAGLAIDGQGNIWSPNASSGSSSNGVTKLVFSGGSYASQQYTDNDAYSVGAIAVDSAGNAWIANTDSKSLTGLVVLSQNGTALTGSGGRWTGGVALSLPNAIAIDASGNVWVSGGNSVNVVEFIGSAKPVKTPVIGPVQLP